jgi:hypothetical protein
MAMSGQVHALATLPQSACCAEGKIISFSPAEIQTLIH